MAQFKTNFFEHIPYFLSHDKKEGLFQDKEIGPKFLHLSELVSKCLHEDWKKNIVNENGENYQHFRPVKDAELTKLVLENKDYFLSIDENNLYERYNLQRFNLEKETDKEQPKKLFKIVQKETTKRQQQPDGSVIEKKVIIEEVQFDLLRIPFEALTKKWQDANLDAAKYAIALTRAGLDQGALQGNPEKVFEDFEKMSHDVHIEWMIREQGWGDVRLFFPYELLSVNSLKNGEKQKDRDQLLVIFSGLSFRSDILAKNRSIVLRALKEVLEEYSNDNGLKQEIANSIEQIQPLIEMQNQIDYERCKNFKQEVKKQTEVLLRSSTSFTFEELEKVCEVYYNEWKKQARTVMKLPKEYDLSYSEFPAMDERLNFKNAATLDMTELIKEMVQEGLLNESLLEGVNAMNNPQSEISQKIAKRNKQDLANYQIISQNQPS